MDYDGKYTKIKLDWNILQGVRWMDICVFDMLHTNSQRVTSMTDLSEIKDFTKTFFNPLPDNKFKTIPN